ncbi:zinc finger protein Xfin isoform X2 [Bicyclus anynana]|uniref:Zinc finger protein Xfin isoform X2 n=1 Tax=Bicyclus anynana TaxID=110368 RepID=A0A6J1N4B2_BICAN|nr:zinc finger protein Xfin isoform X2 [Bicyclus anynana]
MQCCVFFCKNTLDDTTSEGTGITFHAVPRDIHLRASWIRALGTQDCHLPDSAVVCSEHFSDNDFYKTNDCERQIRSEAIPSTGQKCMICLGTYSKLYLMSKCKLEEAYKQLTGLSLCRANLKPTLCVFCAQRLINFSRFRDLCLRAHSLMTDSLKQHEFSTIQHTEFMNYATKHQQCNLTRTTVRADHCDLYIDHTDEDKQTLPEKSVVGDIATVVVKNEYADIAKHEHVTETEILIKLETGIFECEFCFERFLQENIYREHMSMHLQDPSDAIQVCEPRAAASCDPLTLDKTRSQRLYDPLTADSIRTSNAPLSARLAANNGNKVQSTEEVGAIWKNEQILETNMCVPDNQLSQSDTEPSTNINTLTNCVEYDIFQKYKEAVIDNPRVKIQTGVKSYSCDSCHYKSAKKSNLISHMRTHTGQKLYSCDMCDYNCTHESDLSRHKIIHTGQKPCSSEKCHYKCAQKKISTDHMRTHTDEKSHSCETCNYKCASKGSLIDYIRNHICEKPYTCETCNYKFARKGDLIRHKRTHTGEKPFSCMTCDYKCAQKSNLIGHMKIHTGEKPYACDMCNSKFARKGDLTRHKMKHTGLSSHTNPH